MKTINKSIEFNNNIKLNKLEKPNIKLSKIGIISRDYRASNGNSDFSKSFDEILNYCDSKGCDSVVFSLYTLLEKNKIDINKLNRLKNIDAIFIEEFKYEKNESIAGQNKIYYKKDGYWDYREYTQKFGTLKYTNKFKEVVVAPFLKEIADVRSFGNCAVMLCGETNVVKYYRKEKEVRDDDSKLFNHLPLASKIILNPIHDRMTRHEMKKKRQFLSSNDRIVISVWNKGKTDKNGKTRDGKNEPWTIFKNGKELELKREILEIDKFENQDQIEIGILDVNMI